MTRRNSRKIAGTLGGSAFLDRKIYLALSPSFVINSVLVSNHAPNLFNWSVLALVNVLALLACWGWLELFRATIFRNRNSKPVNLGSIIIFGLSLGAIKGIATGAIAAWIRFEPDIVASIANRIWQTPILGLLVVLGASAISAAQARYQEERDLLVAEKIQKETVEKLAAPALDSSELRDFVARAKDQLGMESSPPADLIRNIIESGLRPLSHKLWERENSKYANYGFADLVRLAIVANRYFPWQSAAIYFLITIPLPGFYRSIDAAFERAVLGAAVLLILLWAGQFLRSKSFAQSLANYILVVSVSALAVVAISTLFLGELPGLSSSSVAIAVLLWLVQVTLILGVVTVMREQHKEVRRELSKLIPGSSIERAAKASSRMLRNRELANYLHGSVQNRLLSAAIRIENSNNNQEVLIEELSAVEGILDEIESGLSVQNHESLHKQLANIQSSWQGFVRISHSITNYAANEELEFKIAQAVNEAVSNAVRHGHAKNVSVEIVFDNDFATVRVLDDGFGPRKNSAGLGSKYFRSVAGTNWSLSAAQNGGSLLELQIAN